MKKDEEFGKTCPGSIRESEEAVKHGAEPKTQPLTYVN